MTRPLSIVMLVPPAGSSGPMPRILQVLISALGDAGAHVSTLAWGGDSRAQTSFGNAGYRLRQAMSVLTRRKHSDAVVIQTSLELRSIVVDLPLVVLLKARRDFVVVQFHGGDAHRLAFRENFLFATIARAVLRLADGIFVLSSEEQRSLEKAVPKTPVYTTTNPFVVEAHPSGRSAASKADDFVALFAARLLVGKGILDAIEAVGLLDPSLRCRLVVAGDGPASSEASIKIDELGLQEHVTLRGRVGSADLASLYLQADAFVLPTYLPEGFPTVIAEAMGAGLPIVTTKIRGNADHLQEDVNALFVEPRNPPAIARALRRLILEPGTRARMAAANRAKVATFAPAVIAATYLRSLEGMMAADVDEERASDR